MITKCHNIEESIVWNYLHTKHLLPWHALRFCRLVMREETMVTTDVVAPATGTRKLEAHYRELGGTR